MDKLEDIVREALDLFAGIDDAVELEQVKARFLGKSGALTDLQKGLGRVPAAERPAMGVRFNAAKEQLEAALTARRNAIQQKKLEAQLAPESLDVTLPGPGSGSGGLHPVTRPVERIPTTFHFPGL